MEMKNKILQQAEEQIEVNLAPDNRENYTKIVVAGMHVAMDKGKDGILAAMRLSKDPIRDSAKGALGLVFSMRKMSKGVMPAKALVPAAMTLMLKALDFAETIGLIKVGNDELVQASKIFAAILMHSYKITPAMFKKAAGKINELSADPAAVEKMKLHAGVTQHPDAAKPTPLPPDGEGGLINGTP